MNAAKRTLLRSGGVFSLVVAAALASDDSQLSAEGPVAGKSVPAGSQPKAPSL